MTDIERLESKVDLLLSAVRQLIGGTLPQPLTRQEIMNESARLYNSGKKKEGKELLKKLEGIK